MPEFEPQDHSPAEQSTQKGQAQSRTTTKSRQVGQSLKPLQNEPSKEADGLANLDEKKEEQATSKPSNQLTGDALVAAQLREKFPKGILVSLTIGAAYESAEDVIASLGNTDGSKLDSYSYRANFAAWAKSHQSVFQEKLKSLNVKSLPSKVSEFNDKQWIRAISLVSGNHALYSDIKKMMWADEHWRRNLALTTYKNNKHIPDSAQSFAKSQGAVDGRQNVVIGKAMEYSKSDQIVKYVNATHENVKKLLADNPATESGEKVGDTAVANDEQVAKIRFMSISAHGSPKWLGGHGAASSADFNSTKVPDIVSGLASAFADDIRVRLFACQTAQKSKSDASEEGSIADAFRDALHAHGKQDGLVMGHRTNGETQTNGATRFLHASSDNGFQNWSASEIFNNRWMETWMVNQDIHINDESKKKIRYEVRAFFGRRSWMLESFKTYEEVENVMQELWKNEALQLPSVKSLQSRNEKGKPIKSSRNRK